MGGKDSKECQYEDTEEAPVNLQGGNRPLISSDGAPVILDGTERSKDFRKDEADEEEEWDREAGGGKKGWLARAERGAGKWERKLVGAVEKDVQKAEGELRKVDPTKKALMDQDKMIEQEWDKEEDRYLHESEFTREWEETAGTFGCLGCCTFQSIEEEKLLEKLMEVEDEETEINVGIAGDVYNLYFLTILKKQIGENRIPMVGLHRFAFKGTLGGWPVWAFFLQLSTCGFSLFATWRLQPYQRLTYVGWCMLLVAINMNKYTVEQKLFDAQALRILVGELDDVETGRLVALNWIVIAKSIALLTIFVTTAIMVCVQSTTLDMLKSYASMYFAMAQPELWYVAFLLHRQRWSLGVRQFGNDIAFGDFSTALRLKKSVKKRKWRIWNSVKTMYLLTLLLAASRAPFLHDYTWAKL